MTRKDFISSSAMATAGFTLPLSSLVNVPMQPAEKMKICIFSKQLQWLNYNDMAHAVAEMGFDGIDLTVRNNGHVQPERVTQDLPKAVEAAHAAGIKILMISTDIQDDKSPRAEDILKTASSLGIRYYRSGGLNFKKDVDMTDNLDQIKAKFASLEQLNKKYGLHSDYLNHSGEGFGATLWDLWLTIKDLDPRYVGSQFDIKHASIDGPFSWPVTFRLLHAYIKTLCIRDFRWEKKNNMWDIQPVPLGEGMVDFKKYFNVIKQFQITGPVSLMCDYDLGGAQNGERKLTKPGNEVLQAMKNDLESLRGFLTAEGI
ncbi:MAG TPA: TIM barrel protein [Flavisolibacter sp.]|nr:TIM barrel protein [Flavisolibacter sp.]